MPGYETEFVSSVSGTHTCPACQKALRDPLQTNCGHRFCESCLTPLLRESDPRCPIDDESLDLTKIFRDVCCKKEILSLICFCFFKKYGCDWSGELHLLEEHTPDCQYQEVLCPNAGCAIRLAKLTLQEHITNECLYKKEPCIYCNEPITSAEQEAHFQSCPKFPSACPSNCGSSNIPRDQLEDHKANQCPLTEVSCRFSVAGCRFKGLREEEKKHVAQYEDEHLQMLSRTLAGNQREASRVQGRVEKLESENTALQQQVSTQNETLAKAVQNVSAAQVRLSSAEKAVSEHRQELARIRETVAQATSGSDDTTHVTAQLQEFQTALRQHDHKLAALERDLARGASRPGPASGPRSLAAAGGSDRRLDRNEHQLTLHDITLSEHDLKIKLLEATSYDGSYVWKIDDWKRRLQEAKSGKTPSIYSPPFYVGRFGYKLCARAYPNGDGLGRESHLSLFFVVMRGEYDALLRWPFRQKVSFRLLDQAGGPAVEDSFLPDPTSSSFRRPTSNMNIASGCPLFAAHTTLRSRDYITDDILFVRIDVDKSGLPPVCL